jgi:hypothetical protein
MSSYCKCFLCIHSCNKKKYLIHVNEISKTEPLIHYYDTIHKMDSNKPISDFSQIEYNKTISEVKRMKIRLSGKPNVLM